jgi:hypothetical protein
MTAIELQKGSHFTFACLFCLRLLFPTALTAKKWEGALLVTAGAEEQGAGRVTVEAHTQKKELLCETLDRERRRAEGENETVGDD